MFENKQESLISSSKNEKSTTTSKNTFISDGVAESFKTNSLGNGALKYTNIS